jgi:hypothetical protein
MSVKSFKTSGVGVDLAPQGLVLINTTSFSAVASQNITSVFSATYDFYKIVYYASFSTTARVQMRLLNNTTPVTSNTYIRSQVSTNGSSATQDSGAATSWEMGGYDAATVSTSGDFTIVNVFQAEPTLISGIHGSTSARHLAISNNRQTDNTSFNGYQLIATAGTISGYVQTFGFNK